MNLLLNWDYRLFEYFNGFAGRSGWGDFLIVFVGQYLVYFVAAGLIIYWFLARDPWSVRKRLTLAFVSFFIARFVIVEIIRALYHRPRPFLSYNVTELIQKGNEASFPSGHAAALFAIAASLYFYNKRLAGWLFAAAAVISIARVMAGVHYPSDILAGALIGVVTAWLAEKFLSIKIGHFTPKISALTDKILPFTKR